MTDVNAHPDRELPELIEQQRRDTVDWQRNNNLSPQGESPVVGEVHISDINKEISEIGSEVTLSSPGQRIVGKVVATSNDELWVDWEDGEQTIEKKANFTLIVAAESDAFSPESVDKAWGIPLYYRHPETGNPCKEPGEAGCDHKNDICVKSPEVNGG